MGASRSVAAGAWPRFIAWLSAPLAGRLAARRQRKRLLQLEAEARLRPHDERVLLALADTLRAADRREDAVHRYWQAAQLFVSGCEYPKALAVIQNALVIEPDAFFLRRGAAQTLERLGRNRDAARAYRGAAEIAARRGRTPDAEHLRGRADMLDPPRGRRAPTMVRDLLPEPPEALPPSPLAEALARPAGSGVFTDAPPSEPIEAELAPPEPPTVRPAPEPPAAEPTPSPMLEEPELPAAAPGAAPITNDDPRTRMHIPRKGPAAESGPDVPILRVRSSSEVDAVVAKEMARAFGEKALDERRPSAPPLNPAIEALAREAAAQMHSTELALDAEVFLLSKDPAEAATTQCSANEIHEIKTRTLLAQAERELQSYLTPDDATVEQEAFDPEGSFA